MNVNQAIEILKDNGYKYTDKRENMLQLFSDTNRYLSAKDVLDYLKANYPGLSFDTIYRNLYLFSKLNILETTEINGEKHFRLTCDPNHHHHHFICTDCGKTKQIHTCPMGNLIQEMDDFEITGHKFEIYGKCPDCLS
ncbi:Fur family transcriptional regulator [Calidifontibacillus oryziterrae]|uniref:Fur family transcriptional regulator n=1 Tax=Calidifontibacillus oryziterrae TaxID=1191699 RepID=UPI0002DE14F0|nr:Fur family transcriptional regulator [Calidifontibacillus oryziterrae]